MTVVRVFAVELCESSESGEDIHGSWPVDEEGTALTVCVFSSATSWTSSSQFERLGSTRPISNAASKTELRR